MLQSTRIAIRVGPIIKSKVLIFVNDKLQRDGLETKVYPEALETAEKTKAFFEQDLKLNDVEVCQNYTRDETTNKFAEL